MGFMTTADLSKRRNDLKLEFDLLNGEKLRLSATMKQAGERIKEIEERQLQLQGGDSILAELIKEEEANNQTNAASKPAGENNEPKQPQP